MGNYRNFKLTTYFVAHAAARVTREEIDAQLDFMQKYLRLDKVYLEPWRGEQASHEQIESIEDFGDLYQCGLAWDQRSGRIPAFSDGFDPDSECTAEELAMLSALGVPL